MDVRRTGTSYGPAVAALLAGAALWAASAAPTSAATLFKQTNLLTNADDPNLINPWGISVGGLGDFWISDNGTGISPVYTVTGGTVANPLNVTIPSPTGGVSAPTGQVFNNVAGAFKLANGNPAFFLFASEDGAITGWNGGTTAEIVESNPDAIYKGLAISDFGGGTLYATNFHEGTVDAFDSGFNPVLTGKFVDPNLPSGYAPFGDAVINADLYVTYALQDADKEDDVSGPGNGFVDVYTLDGTLVTRLISGGVLNSPWGIEQAPTDSSWGEFAGALLVGNFGDGAINAFNIHTGDFIGELMGTDGQPISIAGLWGLVNGPGADANSLFFTAGGDETTGLFGMLTPVPEPRTWMTMTIGFAVVGFIAFRRKRLVAFG